MFQPCNKYILIERIVPDELEVESLISLPDDYRPHQTTHELVKIKSVACGVKPPLAADQRAVVLSHMIEEVDFGEEKVYLVLENHVVGIVGKERNNYDR